MARFMYSDDDIKEWYEGAKDKRLQIEILAQLNLVSINDVLDKLVSLGLMTNSERRALRQVDLELDRVERDENAIAAPKEGRARFYAPGYYEKGYTDREIAQAIGCSLSAVQTWRRQECLPRNFKYARHLVKIQGMLASGIPVGTIAKETGIDKRTIRRIQKGEIK